MSAKFPAFAVAAVAATIFLASPSFGQMIAPAGAPPAAAPPAAAPSAPPIGGGAAAPRGNPGGGGAVLGGGGNRGGDNFRGAGRGQPGVIGGGGGNRQAWRDDGRRYGGGYNRGYRGGYGGGVYFGAVPYYGSPYAYDDNYYVSGPSPAGGDGDGDVAYCMRRFKSYDPASGTYLGFDGMRHPCP